MNIETLIALDELRLHSPMPWYMEADNDGGICVKDNRGETVFYEDYGDRSVNEVEAAIQDRMIAKARALGRFLVDFSRYVIN